MARTCAERSGVDLWLSEGSSGFTLLARFRGTARQQPRRTRATDGALAGQKPTPAGGHREGTHLCWSRAEGATTV